MVANVSTTGIAALTAVRTGVSDEPATGGKPASAMTAVDIAGKKCFSPIRQGDLTLLVILDIALLQDILNLKKHFVRNDLLVLKPL